MWRSVLSYPWTVWRKSLQMIWQLCATFCWNVLCGIFGLRLVSRIEFSWHDAAESNERHESATQVLNRRLNSSGVVWGILLVTGEGWKWEWGRMSQTAVFRVRSASLLIHIAHHSNLCSLRPEQEEVRQLWRLLFLFYFTLLLTLSAKNSTVQQETDTIQSVKVIFV